MSYEKRELNKIFISYSSKDKVFVNQLVQRLRKEGYETWLDKHELLVGDPLAEKISAALEETKVILIVVSRASIESKWLKFELNKATQRMIDGKCRLIPILKEKTELPSELKGMLYADFTEAFKFGIKSILTALSYESKRTVQQASFWVQVKSLMEQTFSTGHISNWGEYKSEDYNVINLPVPDADGNEETVVVYEEISDYLGEREPLADVFWSEYFEAMKQKIENMFFLVTQRPVGFSTDEIKERHIHIKKLKLYESTHLYFVILDLARVNEQEKRAKLFEKCEKILCDLAIENKMHIESFRASIKR